MKTRIKIILYKKATFFLLLIFLIQFQVLAQLSGVNTINISGADDSGVDPGGVSGKNYLSFTDAVAALTNYGVNSAVTFNVITGTYNEQITIPAITGASATNTITFQSQSGTNTDVILSNAPTTDNWVVKFNGSQHIRFQNMSITNNSSTNNIGNVLVFDDTNGAVDDINLDNNILSGRSTLPDASFSYAVIYSKTVVSSNLIQNVTITNNQVRNGSYGFYLQGYSSGFLSVGNRIQNNTISDYIYAGVSAVHQDAMIISDNTITGKHTETVEYGILVSGLWNKTQIINNEIQIEGSNSSYGISLGSCEGTISDNQTIANNMILISGTATAAYGINLIDNIYTNVYYNSVNNGSTATNTTATALYVSGGSNLNITNNILANTGKGYAINLQSSPGISTCNYNDLYSRGANLVRSTVADYSNLTAWQAEGTHDLNSISENPLFISNTNLHILSACLDGKGTPVSVSDDFDGESRDGTNPCIGADEISSVALSGSYTIGSGGNFLSFTDAVDALVCNGISDAITFDVITGAYDEQISIPAITGASATNTITFQSQSGTNTDVILSNAPASNNWIVRFNGADFISFRNITIENNSGSAGIGTVFYFENGTSPSNNITIEGNIINGRDINIDDVAYTIISQESWASDENSDNLQILNNSINHGSLGIGIRGFNATNLESGNTISGNYIDNFYVAGIWADYQSNAVIEENTCIGKGAYTQENGIYGNYFDQGTISKNEIQLYTLEYGEGLRLDNSDGTAGTPIKIENNMISILSGTEACDCIYLDACTNVDIYHNSLHINGGRDDWSFALEIDFNGADNTDYNIQNNIFCNSIGSAAIYFTNYGSNYITSCDYNLFYVPNTYDLAFDDGGSWTTLADWQGETGFDLNSVSENPPFISASNLHINTATPTLIESGGSSASIFDDIDGDIRFGEIGYAGVGTAVDIGADEGNFTELPGLKNALDFDGIDDYVDIPFIIDPDINTFTVECWFKVIDPAGTDDVIIAQMNGTGTGRGWLKVDASTQKLESFLGGITLASINTLNANQWYHAALTFDGTDLSLYLDGVFQNTNTPTMEACDGNTILGSFSGAAPWFSGQMDELRIWSIVRTPDEIRENMCKSIDPVSAGLLAYCDFNEASGTNLPDLTGNGNDGTLNSMDNADWVNSGAFTTWTGAINATDWLDDSNWTNGAPDGTPSSNAGFPDVVNDLQLNSSQSVNHLVIGTGSGLSVINAAMNLRVSGNAFSFSQSLGNGAVELSNGISLHFIAGDFSRIEINDINYEIGLASNVYINDELVLTSGKVNIYDYDMQLLSGAIISGSPDNTNYVIAEHGGSLIQEVISGSKFYPVGTDTEYCPVTLNDNSGTSDNYGIRVYPDVTVDGIEGSAQIANIDNVVKMTWIIEEENPGSVDLDITLEWNGAIPPEGASFDRSNCGIGHYTTGTWQAQFTAPAGGSDPYNRTISIIDNLGSFAVGDIASLLAEEAIPLGNALNFDGVDDEMIITDNAALRPDGGSITIEMWVKLENINQSYVLFEKILNVDPFEQIGLWVNGANSLNVSPGKKIAFNFIEDDNASERNGYTTNDVIDGNWHHIAYVADAGANDIKIYIDGNSEALTFDRNNGAAWPVVNNTDDIRIFCDIALPVANQHTKGQITELRYWNIARSQTDIQNDLFSYVDDSHSNYSNLVAYYRFDQGRDAADNTDLPNEVIDYSLNCNTGTLNGFALSGTTGNWVSTTNPQAPILTTSSVYNVTFSSADVNFEIFDTGASTSGGYGLCWSISSCPTINDNSVSAAATISNSVYTQNLSCLFSGTNYYVRAFAWNSEGLSYGETKSFTTTAIVGYHNVWSGCESNDWFNPANWSINAIPVSTDDILIPGNTTYQPTILLSSPVYNPTNANAECKTITIDVDIGAIVTIEAGRLLKTN